MVNELVYGDVEEYKKHYEELMRVSWDDGVLLPVVLGSMPDPKSDVLKLDEIEYTLDKDENRIKLLLEREEKLDYIMGDLDVERGIANLNKFYVQEVRKFIKKYPQFKSVFIFEKVEE